MKELSIEEKAKRYDEAIAKAKQFSDKPYLEDSKGIVEYLFPELKKNDDERMYERIVGYLKVDIEEFPERKDRINEMIAWLEKQGEKKTVFDVEIPFGTDSGLIEEAITIPDGCYAIIEDNKVILRKGEKKSSWSEEDEVKLQNTIDYIEELIHLTKCNPDIDNDDTIKYYQDSIHWLKSLKDRVQLNPKQDWNEEDEKAINDIMWIIEAYRENGFNESHKQIANNAENWLKSRVGCDLKRTTTWRPSEEEMKALEFCIEHNIDKDGVFGSKVVKLYEKLKKLREE